MHMSIISLYVAATSFVVDVGVVAHVQLEHDLGRTHQDMVTSTALNYAGLSLASIVLIPLAYRYGRRPIYLVGALLQVLASVCMAKVTSKYQYMACSTVICIGAAASQTLVPLTIADLFFVHQFATMNGVFIFAQGAGAFLGPVAAGFMVEWQGWRWSWLLTAMLLAVAFFLLLFLLEESTFVPTAPAETTESLDDEIVFPRPLSMGCASRNIDLVNINRTMGRTSLELPPAPKSLGQRFALVTKTKRPIKERFLSPFVIILTFPAVAYASLTCGAIVTWLAMYNHIAQVKLFEDPYDFNPKDMGLFRIHLFTGHAIGSLLVSALSDRYMLVLAQKNDGLHHPETRLRFALPGAVLACAGILVFGIGISKVCVHVLCIRRI